MEYLVSAGLLVAVLAWVSALCHRLRLLRAELQGAWADWLRDTRCRNETLGEFAELAAVLLPRGEMLPRTLRRLVADSNRVLKDGERLLWRADRAMLRAEQALRQEAEQASKLHHEGLLELGERLARELERQGQSERRFRLAAECYNAALAEPPVRLVAPGFGFTRVPLPGQ
ncbi:MAG: hypothetical protein MJ051_08210 [Akkermansia sp.]|nr:hypothetical protein [Akkermansia sp.]